MPAETASASGQNALSFATTNHTPPAAIARSMLDVGAVDDQMTTASVEGPTMTDKAIDALVERLEKASGPERELDAALWLTCVEKPASGDKYDRDMIGRWPTYTASIDAAMTLFKSQDGEGALHMFWFEGSKSATVIAFECDDSDGIRVAGRTLPIALCIAALRSRQSGGVSS